MYLDEILLAQKRGRAKGITSVCSAHLNVITQTLKVSESFGIPPLIEATCNQVNQFGGYTGMTPVKFAEYVRGLAQQSHYPFADVILGGDHLGPHVWRNEPAESAMAKSREMVQDYVHAGFTKIHLDCSMRLADDPGGALNIGVSARRAAELAKAAEDALTPDASSAGRGELRYVIGTEVPRPGGAMEHREAVSVSKIEDVRETIEVTREAFSREGLGSAWKRVIAIVVQPGIEFGDDFVLPYHPDAAQELSRFVENQPMIFEAHSTDYQTRGALRNLVRDHFGILKAGPALTFAFREAVFALAMIERELIAEDQRSNVIQVLDDAMMAYPEHWREYYRGTEDEQAFKRKFSLSDRLRYYWVQPEVQSAFGRLIQNLGNRTLPYSLLSQFVGETDLDAGQVIQWKITKVLKDYMAACEESM